GPVVLWLCLSAQRYHDASRHGHPDFRSQVDRLEGSLSVWLILKDGRPPRAVQNLGLLVRRSDDRDRELILTGVAGTRTINHVGPMPPHVLYPDQFQGAPPLAEGTYYFIWSRVEGGKR